MDLHTYQRKILEAGPEDWQLVTCSGATGGPSFLKELIVEYGAGHQFMGLEISSHGMRAALKSDLAVGIAWGLSKESRYQSDWSEQFEDPIARSSHIDFFYNGMLIFRDSFVSVDGGRCRLPEPDLTTAPGGPSFAVGRQRNRFFKIFDSLELNSNYDSYFRRAGFILSDDSWIC